MRKFEIVKDNFRKFPNVEIKLPKRADSKSAGYDFYSNETVLLLPNHSHVFWTDVKVTMYADNVLKIYTRSGNGTKKGVVLRNNVGIIDASYYENPSNDGNIGICLYNFGTEPFEIAIGDRIAQGIFQRYLIVDEDSFFGENSINDSRSGGFGSSGK